MRAIILDDEHHCTNALRVLLENYTDLKVVGIYNDVLQALKEIDPSGFDILFLDIEMPYMNGFEFLNHFEEIGFKVIFTTAYDDYAIKAFKVRAIDYLMKPISRSELIKAVNHARNMVNDQSINSRLFSDMQSRMSRIAVTSVGGLELVETKDILYLIADSNYTRLKLTNGGMILCTKTLKVFDKSLMHHGFIRVHNSHLVNAIHITRYVKGDGGYLVLTSGDHVSVSRSKKDELITFLNNFS